MKIAVDAMGGDNAPGVVVEGAVEACTELGLSVLLVGDEGKIAAELEKFKGKNCVSDGRITVKHASEAVGMHEHPLNAARRKKDSSLRVCFDAVKAGEAGSVVTAGNSGAALATAIFVLKRLKGVARPAIAVRVPTMKRPAVLLDVGGNVDCSPKHLVQFAIMGDIYAKDVLNEERPKIGLLSNAEEEGKGNELTRETHELLKKTSLNYIGHVEGRDIFHGDVDVVVTDGFVGNVALKLTEGLAVALSEMLKTEIKVSLPAKLGYLLARGAFQKIKKRLDYAEYGGAPLLGIDGICMISHGGSCAKAIKNAIRVADECAKTNLNTHMTEVLAKSTDLKNLSSENSVNIKAQ
jgi:glycerol-3-phosphate acyltransferase PlsX